MSNRLIAAADGSALGNPGPAGWAWYIDESRWAAGGWEHGTNNMGELMAVLDLLRATRAAGPLTILCDSQYVINSVTKWMAGWKRKGWKKGDGKPVLNLELMQAIDAEMTGEASGGGKRDVTFEWVKGHAGHPLNEAADRLANGAALTYQKGGVPDPGPGLGGGAETAAAAPVRQGGPSGRAGGTEGSATASSPTRTHASSARGQRDSQAEQGALLDELEPSELDRVIDLERALLESDVRSSPRMMDRLLHPQWSEFGAGGRVISREDVVAGLGEANVDLEVLDASFVADHVVLLRWRAHSDHGTSLRTSVWVREGDRWRQRHHQGTAEGA